MRGEKEYTQLSGCKVRTIQLCLDSPYYEKYGIYVIYSYAFGAGRIRLYSNIAGDKKKQYGTDIPDCMNNNSLMGK